jgi:hypothetical protein
VFQGPCQWGRSYYSNPGGLLQEGGGKIFGQVAIDMISFFKYPRLPTKVFSREMNATISLSLWMPNLPALPERVLRGFLSKFGLHPKGNS